MYIKRAVEDTVIKVSADRTAARGFHVLDPVQEPQKFGGLDELKITLGTKNVGQDPAQKNAHPTYRG